MKITNAQVGAALSLLGTWEKTQREAILEKVGLPEINNAWNLRSIIEEHGKKVPANLRKMLDKVEKLEKAKNRAEEELEAAVTVYKRARRDLLDALSPELTDLAAKVKAARLEVQGSVLSGTPLADILAKLGINL